MTLYETILGFLTIIKLNKNTNLPNYTATYVQKFKNKTHTKIYVDTEQHFERNDNILVGYITTKSNPHRLNTCKKKNI